MKRGRPNLEKVPFSAKRFQEALDYNGISLRKLNTDPVLNASERTIRRAKQTGMINPDILDRLGKRLNVDPRFISGTCDVHARARAENDEEATELASKLKVEDYPYLLQEKRKLMPMQYINDLLIEHDIPTEELNQLSEDERIRFYVDLEIAIERVFNKYFTPFRASIHNYSIPMPPEDEIGQMVISVDRPSS